MSDNKNIIDYHDFGKRLQKARRNKGCTQQKLAESMNITNKKISDLENGKTQMRVHELYEYVNYLDLNLTELSYPWLTYTYDYKANELSERLNNLPEDVRLTAMNMIDSVIKELEIYSKRKK